MTASAIRTPSDPATRTVLRLYAAFQLFFGLLFWIPIFYEYQKRIGLSDSQIFAVQTIYYAVFCLLEIPTGMAADRWGARRCMVLGAAVLVGSHALAATVQSYTGFLSHYLLVGVARSLISGAASAYLYDFLAARGAAAEFKEVEGRARAYGLAAKVVCWAFVGAAMQWRLTAPYWLTAAGGACALYAAWRLPPSARERGESDAPAARPSPLADITEVGRVLARSPMLLFAIVQGVAIFVLARIFQVNLFQPVLSARGLGLWAHGGVMSAMTVFEALGSWRPGWLRRYVSDLNAVFVLTLAMAGAMVATTLLGIVGAVVCFCVFGLATGLSYPIQRQVLNDLIPDSRYRATLLSVESIVDRAACSLAAVAMGRYLADGRLDALLVHAAVATFALTAVLYAVLQRRRARRAARAPATG